MLKFVKADGMTRQVTFQWVKPDESPIINASVVLLAIDKPFPKGGDGSVRYQNTLNPSHPEYLIDPKAIDIGAGMVFEVDSYKLGITKVDEAYSSWRDGVINVNIYVGGDNITVTGLKDTNYLVTLFLFVVVVTLFTFTLFAISFSDTLSNGVFPQDIYIEDFESVGHTIEPIYIAVGTLEAKVKYNNKETKAIIAGTGTSNVALSLTGRTISNLGATGSKIYNLPVATKGLEFTFRVEEANQSISVLPQSGTLILGLMRSTSSNVSSNVLGDYITVKAREDGNWDVVNIKGIWSLIDTWTTAQRPVSPKTGKEGYNTTLGVQEYYNGTAWVQNATTANATTTTKGLVNQSAYSADTATVASGANPTKAEFDALLAEFRDFKTKSRTSGQSATS